MDNKFPVCGLSIVALDWAVATVEGLPIQHNPMGFSDCQQAGYWVWDDHAKKRPYQLIGYQYHPSSNWSQAGEIIFKYGIATRPGKSDSWIANLGDFEHQGGSPMEAAMRCYVESRLGCIVTLPLPLIRIWQKSQLTHQAIA